MFETPFWTERPLTAPDSGARNQAEDLDDEVARLKEWKKPELSTNSGAKVNILTSSFKFREDVIGKSRTFLFANQQSQDVTQFGQLNCSMAGQAVKCRLIRTALIPHEMVSELILNHLPLLRYFKSQIEQFRFQFN
jgi:hypothetical protein